VLGISKDSVAAQARFKAKYHLPFTLLSDKDGIVCDAYGVLVQKNMYGKFFKGIERTSFLIDPEGKVAKVYPKVKIDGHVRAVLDDI
jgi:thioredoxin-dependent peroxiredoxin